MNTELSQDATREVGRILNTLLADEFALYVKTLNYHWNVKGLMFNDLHLFFRATYEELFDIVDEVAERARAIGIRSLGSMSEFLEFTHLSENTQTNIDEKQMLQALLDDHEEVIRFIRVNTKMVADVYNDVGTENFLADLLEKQEKRAWMLRSYLSR